VDETLQLSASLTSRLGPEAQAREVAVGWSLSDTEVLELTARGLPPT
jgi:hypothetical protein